MPNDPQMHEWVCPAGLSVTDWLAATGRQTTDALCAVADTPILLHPDVIAPFASLKAVAHANGFTLTIASGYRSFDRQLAIWNGKASGQRTVLDSAGQVLDTQQLPEEDLLFAILRWSAIPGCSRHHWGTDMDVYDAAAVAPDYALQLTTAEASGTGPFAAMHNWLDSALVSDVCDFFRPYACDTGGIAPERWHLSHAPTAERYEKCLDENRLIDWLMTQDIALKPSIYKHWHTIYHRYVRVSHSA